jgi:hypothetical protein
LLPTHLHLLFRVKDRKQIEYVYPEAGMLSWQVNSLFAVYTKAINHSCSRSGGLFTKSSARRIPIARELVCQLIAYIHMNPQIHGVVSDFHIWPFSSCFAYLRQDRRSMIAKDLLLDPVYQRRILKLQESSGVREANWDS